jgi:hypothetical protein
MLSLHGIMVSLHGDLVSLHGVMLSFCCTTNTKKAFILSKKGKYSKTLSLEMSARTVTAPELLSTRLGCAGFAKKNFHFKAKRGETKRNQTRFARSHEKMFYASFCFKFFASNQSKIKTAFFHFASLLKICCFVSFRFQICSFRFKAK